MGVGDMTKGASIHSFFNSFMTAYPVNEVPKEATFPYMTYELMTGAWGDETYNMVVDLWFKTDSESTPNAKAQEFSDLIGLGGVCVQYTGGAVWLKRGSPWCQSMVDEHNENVKRRHINVLAEFMSAN